jgi:hypothetical protein
MLHCAVWYKFTDVSEVLAACIIRAMSTVSIFSVTTQKNNIVIFAAMRTSNLIKIDLGEKGCEVG